MKRYQEVSIKICRLEPQDIVTESGGLSFLKWFISPSIENWDPNYNDGIGREWNGVD